MSQPMIKTHVFTGHSQRSTRFDNSSLHQHTYDYGVSAVENAIRKDTKFTGKHSYTLILLSVPLSQLLVRERSQAHYYLAKDSHAKPLCASEKHRTGDK